MGDRQDPPWAKGLDCFISGPLSLFLKISWGPGKPPLPTREEARAYSLLLCCRVKGLTNRANLFPDTIYFPAFFLGPLICSSQKSTTDRPQAPILPHGAMVTSVLRHPRPGGGTFAATGRAQDVCWGDRSVPRQCSALPGPALSSVHGQHHWVLSDDAGPADAPALL